MLTELDPRPRHRPPARHREHRQRRRAAPRRRRRPSAGNLALTQGSVSTATALMAEMGTGLLVTSMIGASINPTTGDYSRGASGFWVENGEIVRPVNECTIAGNLRADAADDPAGQRRAHLARPGGAEPAGRRAGHCRSLTLDLLLEAAAREAGALALACAGRPGPVREKPGGLGPVSEADLAVDGMLRDAAPRRAAGYGWLSEESEDGPARLAREAGLHRRSDRRHPRLPRRPSRPGRIRSPSPRPARRRRRRPHAGARRDLRRGGVAAAPPATARRSPASVRSVIDGARVLANASQLDARALAGRRAGGRAPLPPLDRLPPLPRRRRQRRRDAELPRDLGVGRGRRATDRARGGRRSSPTRDGAPLAYNRPDPRVDGIIAAPTPLHAALLALR